MCFLIEFLSTVLKTWKTTKMILYLLLLFPRFILTATEAQHPSCVFNPLCTCSRSDANLGIVTCSNIPLLRIPTYVKHSKINTFQLENNGLRVLESHLLVGTGIHVLKIKRNPIHAIPADLFKGLETSLRELELSYLNLIEVPREALYRLQRLQTLNLAGNDLTDVSQNNWVNVRSTLETLILRENAISKVPANAFERFSRLKVLDLSKNILLEIDPDAFFPDTHKLIHLFLADNQLRFIPYAQLQHLRSLKTLDLNENFITKVNAVSESTRTNIDTKFSLNVLHLKYNDIRSLSAEDFDKFSVLNATYLDGNPITMIQTDTFQNVRINELSLSGCGLAIFHAGMVKGLERSLTILDLSYNNLRSLDANLFRYFTALEELKTRGNSIENFAVPDFNNNILSLEVEGNEYSNYQAVLQDIGRIKSLIRISISNIEIPYITATHFLGYGFGIEELAINKAFLKTIHAQAFNHIRGIKKVDLSDNEITDIHEQAFVEVGHSLRHLHLANAFASSVKIFPHVALNHLTSIRVLDISNNYFEDLPTTTFHAMRDLEILRLHDCQIRTLRPQTFPHETHVRLREATFSFNQLKILKSFTFSDLPELEYVNFEDNQIELIELRALNNLKKLKWIYLRGNRIEMIDQDAFANLPELELLDLAFNNLKNFDFSCLDQVVGSSVFLSINLTFNGMYGLQVSSEAPSNNRPTELNIKVMDVSYNNISNISIDYFTPFEYSLTHLYLAHNLLTNVSQDVFGSLDQLQWLDISNNRLQYIGRDSFKDVNKIQILNFGHNELQEIPPNLFYGMKSLRIVDLSDNRLTFLPDYSFREDSLESLLLGENHFVKVPFKSFSSEVAKSLKEIDMSNNQVSAIHTSELLSQFQSLAFLNVSGNHLHQLEESLFFYLSKLLYLDVSHNNRLQFANNGKSFLGIQDNLVYLGLKNISLVKVPDLPFSKLVYLQLSHNNISTITPESVVNLTSVRVLDLSCNNFTSLPVVLLSMRNLRVLNISRNEILVLSNNSLLSGFEELRELDITKLPLSTFETGALSRLISLNTLHVSTYEDVDHFNIPKVLEKNNALKHLHVDATLQHLDHEMSGMFPKKLRKVTISGVRLDSVASEILAGISALELELVIDGTNIESIDEDVFKNLHRVRNITLDARNNLLKYLSNPSTTQFLGSYNLTFLLHLKVSGNKWNCKCDIGWIETWKRTARQVLCSHLQFSISQSTHSCITVEDDLRKTLCANGQSLMHTMKAELECGWSRSSYMFQIKLEYFLILSFVWIFNVLLKN